MTTLAAPFAAARISSRWGDRTYRNAAGKLISAFHCAVDYAVASGTPVRAAAPGTVVEVSHSAVRGYMVAVDHGGGIGTRYHMLASAHRPRVGARVERGDEIGRVATRAEWGSSSSGDHVHVEVRTNGAIRGETTARANTPNPLNHFSGVAVAASGATPIGADMAFTYEDAEDRHKQSIQRDIMGHGLKGVPDKHGVRYVPIELLIEASQRSERAMNASEAILALVRPLVQTIKDTRTTQLEDSTTFRAKPAAGGPLVPAERVELETLRAERVARAAELRAEADRLDPKVAA